MIAALKKELLNLGFAAHGRNEYRCRSEGVVHIVRFAKDRHGDIAIQLLVWNPIFQVDAGQAQSPIVAHVAPVGVDENWTWSDGSSCESSFLKLVVTEFFRGFSSLNDVRFCLQDQYVAPVFQDRLAVDKGEIDENFPWALYPCPGGALNYKKAREAVAEMAESALSNLGFSITDGHDVIAVKPREEIIDCVRLYISPFNVFVYAECFQWSDAIWKIDRRTKGTYYPLNPRAVTHENRNLVWPIARLKDFDSGLLREAVESVLAQQRTVGNLQQLAEAAVPQWSSMKSLIIAALRGKR